MTEPEKASTAHQGHVTQGNDPRERMLAELLALRLQGATYEELAEELGVSKAALYKALNNPDYWSDRVIEGVLKERWVSLTARVRLPVDVERGTVPSSLMIEFELRRCPVTDHWFIAPAGSTQRFTPGLSEAVKRAARRDLKKARDKYRQKGDWGQG